MRRKASLDIQVHQTGIPNTSCEWVLENHQNVFARQTVGHHLHSCTDCTKRTEGYFEALAFHMQDALKEFQALESEFKREVSNRAEASCRSGMVDPSTALLLEICQQLGDDSVKYYHSAPHNNMHALAWLQRAFFLCRVFESEKLLEKGKFLQKPLKVGEMTLPNGRQFKDVTSPSTMFTEHLTFGTFTFNHELQQQLIDELNAGKFVHALVLICDSPKHAVMSSLLNLAATAHTEQIYYLGFKAASIAIRIFCEQNGMPVSRDEVPPDIVGYHAPI